MVTKILARKEKSCVFKSIPTTAIKAELPQAWLCGWLLLLLPLFPTTVQEVALPGCEALWYQKWRCLNSSTREGSLGHESIHLIKGTVSSVSYLVHRCIIVWFLSSHFSFRLKNRNRVLMLLWSEGLMWRWRILLSTSKRCCGYYQSWTKPFVKGESWPFFVLCPKMSTYRHVQR